MLPVECRYCDNDHLWPFFLKERYANFSALCWLFDELHFKAKKKKSSPSSTLKIDVSFCYSFSHTWKKRRDSFVGLKNKQHLNQMFLRNVTCELSLSYHDCLDLLRSNMQIFRLDLIRRSARAHTFTHSFTHRAVLEKPSHLHVFFLRWEETNETRRKRTKSTRQHPNVILVFFLKPRPHKHAPELRWLNT